MSSTPPEASSCYFTETARSLRAALDAKPDTNDISSEPHPSADPHIDIASAAKNADTFTKAEKTPTMPSASITNASVLKTSQGNPSNSDDTDIVYHPKLQGVIGIPDLNFTMERLITVPNNIIKEHYGDRIRFSTDFGNPYTIAWSIKADDVLDPIAIVIRWPQNGSLDVMRKTDDGENKPLVAYHGGRNRKMMGIATNIKEKHGCDRVGFYDGVDLVLYTLYPGPPPGAHMFPSYLNEIRSKLMSWLGEAIRNTNVQMLKPLTGYTLEDSNLEALALDTPPQRLANDRHLDISGLLALEVEFGGCAFKIYTTEDGRVVTVEDCPLPTVDDKDIATAAGVRASSQSTLNDYLILIGEENTNDELKYSCDIIPDALVWYVRKPNEGRAKEFICILQFAAAGTIVPGDWGLRKPDLTFTNGEGIVRTAKPLYDSMLLMGQQRDCYSVALFDYRNVVFVTRCKGNKVNASVSLITGDRIRGAFLQWLLRALQIAEEEYIAVD